MFTSAVLSALQANFLWNSFEFREEVEQIAAEIVPFLFLLLRGVARLVESASSLPMLIARRTHGRRAVILSKQEKLNLL